ncbi:MAG: glycosyltransferase family 9 protein [Deltaproteobacteria bacterium]|jgi:ADP-heptose:LPS heptosyltransferase|nr:glycosyltransferase family 9 protein [Deltaproteobacteria bacterium]
MTDKTDMPARPDFAGSGGKTWLVYRLSALGDVALLSGVLDYWHRSRGWRFIVMTKEPYADLFRQHPAVIGTEAVRPEDLARPAAYFREVAARYKGCGLLDLHGTLRSRLLGFFWKGEKRGYGKLSWERRLFLRLRTPSLARRLRALNVPQRYALAVEDTPPPARDVLPRLYLDESERTAATERLAGIFGAGQAIAPLVLHPYATHALKQWPLENWRELAGLLDRHGLPWLVVGRGEGLFPGDARDLSNSTSLRELCALLEGSSLLITGDSGPLHLGAAMRLPVLALFGPTTAEWGFFPAGERDRVLELDLPCRPCSLHGAKGCAVNGECLRGIAPQQVLEAALSMR